MPRSMGMMAEQLGRYILEGRIAAGGMAEVFLAKQSGPEGFARVCVVKRMLASLAADTQFVRMFLDEARLAAQLNHPNIAQIFDFGHVNNTYFLAMEYVPGVTLRALVKENARRELRMPVPLAVRLISHAALALDYAHKAVGQDGAPLKIIHRDVSPQNILLSTSGTVKLIDFGVAKASSASQKTKAGLVKGKFAYMSPEQIRGQSLDARSDIYGLALVLYELLTNARAIPGENDVAIVQNAMKMRFEPIERKRPDVPEPVRAILARALQKSRDARYPSAAALSEDLERYLVEARIAISATDLASLIPESAQSSDRSTLSPASSENVALGNRQPGSGEFWGQQTPARTDIVNGGGQTDVLTPSGIPLATAVIPPSGSQPAAPSPLAGTAVIPPPAHLAQAVRSDPPWQGAPPQPTWSGEPYRTPLYNAPRTEVVAPPGSAFPDDGESSASILRHGIRKSPLPWILSGAVLAAGVSLVGYLAFVQGRPPPPASDPIVATPTPPPPEVNPVPPEVNPPPPLPDPPQPPPVASAQTTQPKPALQRPIPRHAPDLAATPSPTAPPASMAILEVYSTPSTNIAVDGENRGRSPVRLPLAAGDHTIQFSEERLGLKHERSVRLERGESRREEWRPQKGTVLFRAVPYAEVFLAGNRLGITPLEPVELWEGNHEFKFVNRDTNRTELKTVYVNPGKEVTVKVDLRAR